MGNWNNIHVWKWHIASLSCQGGIKIWKQTWWLNDKTVIELDNCKIHVLLFLSVSQINYLWNWRLQQINDLLANDKSRDFPQPRPEIVKYFSCCVHSYCFDSLKKGVGTFHWLLVHGLPRWTWSMDYLNGLPMDYPKWTTLKFVANINLTMLEPEQNIRSIDDNYGTLAI